MDSHFLVHNPNGSSHTNITNSTANNDTEGKIYNKLGLAPVYLTIYVLFLVFAVVGNCLVCWIVKVNPTMQNITNYLLVNLAVSDLIQALSTLFHVADFVVKDLRLGAVGCKFQINMFNIPYGTSCLTLTVIAVERYYAVCRPLRFPGLKKRIKMIIPLTWLGSLLMYLPTIIFCGERQDKESNQLSCDCVYLWPSLEAKNIYGIFLVIVFYIIPLISVLVFYSQVICRLRVSPPGEGQSSKEMYKSRQKVVKMLLVTIALFFVMWTPYNVLYLLKRLEVDYRSIYPYVWYPGLLLAFLTTAYNPVVYCFMGRQFKEGFKSALCCCHRRCPLPKISNIWASKATRSSQYSMENID